ncbi:MAG: M48 family metallopeptidase [Candidatus Cloacimonetes bacterium]|nr:M48 family metallopeptidase [Candidatus Cloacimonadota bacterium]
MKYVGMAIQQKRNNTKSVILLMTFPLLLLVLLFLGCYFSSNFDVDIASERFFSLFLYVLVGVGIWFVIAYITNVKIIDFATGARTLLRSENPRVYNLVENLCISCGMTMPQIHIVDDPALNAFASGVSQKSYTVTLTSGIINELNDSELEGVIAHELTHIRNHDVQVLIISIVFVGIFALIAQMSFRFLRVSGGLFKRSRGKSSIGVALVMLIIVALAFIGYLFSTIIRFSISRKREYLADVGATWLTRNPLALASALRKISGNSSLSKKHESTVAQLFIEHNPNEQSFLSSIFATHPCIHKRIKILEQF